MPRLSWLVTLGRAIVVVSELLSDSSSEIAATLPVLSWRRRDCGCPD